MFRGKGRETLSPEQLKQSPDRIGLRNRMRIIIFIFVFFITDRFIDCYHLVPC